MPGGTNNSSQINRRKGSKNAPNFPPIFLATIVEATTAKPPNRNLKIIADPDRLDILFRLRIVV
jgi:hypothetical protein